MYCYSLPILQASSSRCSSSFAATARQAEQLQEVTAAWSNSSCFPFPVHGPFHPIPKSGAVTGALGVSLQLPHAADFILNVPVFPGLREGSAPRGATSTV